MGCYIDYLCRHFNFSYWGCFYPRAIKRDDSISECNLYSFNYCLCNINICFDMQCWNYFFLVIICLNLRLCVDRNQTCKRTFYSLYNTCFNCIYFMKLIMYVIKFQKNYIQEMQLLVKWQESTRYNFYRKMKKREPIKITLCL